MDGANWHIPDERAGLLPAHTGRTESHRMTILPLDPDNRMARMGFGKNKGNWFFRIDLWFFGFRFGGAKSTMEISKCLKTK
jgi:hypothetical protein